MKNKRKRGTEDKHLREHLLYLLRGGGAHIGFEAAIRKLPPRLRSLRPKGIPYSLWQLLEHMRICQWDILDFCVNPQYQYMNWPKDYWPASPNPPNAAAWEKSVRAFRRDLRAMQKLVANSHTDLFARIPWGKGQTILREALLLADHNAYHMGQLVLVRRLLRAWGNR